MKFPGSKLLHHWDLSTQQVALTELLTSCQQVGLTGLAEVRLPQAAGMIFYYLGVEVNALYREGALVQHGAAALERLRLQANGGDGSVAVYELPVDLAHLLRGISQRRRLAAPVRRPAELAELLHGLERAEHTGTLELYTADGGAAMLLLVRGRLSNLYWESADGLTVEKGEARQRLEAALDGRDCQVHLGDFSRDTWKSRHEGQEARRSRLERRAAEAPSDELALEEQAGREQLLEALEAELPALIQACVFDLLTGSVLARRGRGTAAVKVGVLSERLPALALYARDLLAADDGDRMEQLQISAERVTAVVECLPEMLEGVAVLVDRSQPLALIGTVLARAGRAYAARHAARETHLPAARRD